ncbi:MAG: ABC transporter [Gammaproteobacteria bacterium]|nr:ABC transporter [Gammaproteobacteria bacterium]|tara:strand:- start:694 stop:1458 length:765 start_codon:yes stop_codon:yes gene_type:complete
MQDHLNHNTTSTSTSIPKWLVLAVILISGCSTTNTAKHDPLEPMNRAIFGFNEVVDKTVLEPIAKTYKYITPDPVEVGVSNFFNNLGEINTIINDIFQLKFKQAGFDFTRLVINSTIGVLGIFDVASDMGLKRNKEDFGQTLGYWGIESGPYLVLPFFGPSSLRDAPGMYADYQTNESVSPVRTELHHEERDAISIVEVVDTRARLLKATQILETAAKDKYVFIRESYLQRRESLVNDGEDEEDFEIDVIGVDY